MWALSLRSSNGHSAAGSVLTLLKTSMGARQPHRRPARQRQLSSECKVYSKYAEQTELVDLIYRDRNDPNLWPSQRRLRTACGCYGCNRHCGLRRRYKVRQDNPLCPGGLRDPVNFGRHQAIVRHAGQDRIPGSGRRRRQHGRHLAADRLWFDGLGYVGPTTDRQHPLGAEVRGCRT